jgi:pimeloyl-ACP methyl ester carboxylesterase
MEKKQPFAPPEHRKPQRFSLFLLGFLFSFTLFSQDVQTEEVEIRNGDILLPGTLRIPEGREAFPLLIFIPGSGNIDRDGNQAGTMVKPAYIRQLGEALAGRDLAFFSYDKRTAVPENRPFLDTVLIRDYVSDLQALVGHFQKDDRFDGIHLLGHSQGSLVGMLSVSEKGPVRSLVSIAGPASPIDSVIIRQLAAQSPDLAGEAAAYLKRLKEGRSPGEVTPALRPLFAPANQPILKEWMQYQPVAVFGEVEIPVLLVYGEEDTQVTPEAGSRLKKVRPGTRLIRIQGMNHVLKQLESPADNLRAYSDPSLPLSPDLVREIVNWVGQNR